MDNNTLLKICAIVQTLGFILLIAALADISKDYIKQRKKKRNELR